MENVIRTEPKLGIKVTPCHKQIFVPIFAYKLHLFFWKWEWECSAVNKSYSWEQIG